MGLCLRVLERPSVRGHAGRFTLDNTWLITGSGVQKKVIRQWKEEGGVPNNWVKELGENFLEDFLEKDWKKFTCCKGGQLDI
jgi:hypothetical protein